MNHISLHGVNSIKITAKSIVIKYWQLHQLIIICNIITQIPLTLASNKKNEKRRILKRTKLLVLEHHTLDAEDEFSWHPLSLTITTPPPLHHLLSANKKSNNTFTTGAWGRRIIVGAEKNNSQTTAVIALHNSLNKSLHCGQCYGQIEFISYKKVS